MRWALYYPTTYSLSPDLWFEQNSLLNEIGILLFMESLASFYLKPENYQNFIQKNALFKARHVALACNLST